MREILIYFYLKYQNDFTAIYNALETREKVDEELLEKLKKEHKEDFETSITLIDEDYPDDLKLLSHPPFVLKSNFTPFENRLMELNKLPKDVLINILIGDDKIIIENKL